MPPVLLNLNSDLPDAALALLTRDLKNDLLRAGFAEAPAAQAQTRGEKGDPVTIGAIALAAFSSGGAVNSLLKCVQAILARDRSLRIKLKWPKGPDIEIDAKNIASADLHATIEAAVAAAKPPG